MFDQTFVADGNTKRERKIALAIVLQAVGVTGLALLPLFSTEPIGAGKRFVLLPPAPLKVKPVVVEQKAAASNHALSTRVVRIESLAHRIVPPTRILPLVAEDAPTIATHAPASTDGAVNGLLISLGQGVTPPIPPPTRIPPVPKTPRAPVRISRGVTQSMLLSGPKPPYPRLALTARISGNVRLQATISREGRIENLHVLSGHPLLNDAAMDAVRQWRYQPLLLNGDPVEVITEIDVNFTLNP